MKKFIVAILTLAILATMFTTISFIGNVGATSTNLITGDLGTFEGASVPVAWTALAGGTLAQSTTVFHNGTKSLALTGRGTNTWYSPAYNIYDIVKANGAGTYTASLWVRASAGGSVGLLVRFASAGQYSFASVFSGVPANYSRIAPTNITLAADTWAQVTGTFTVTAADIAPTTGVMSLCIDSINSDAVYIDDVSLTLGVSPTATPVPASTPAYKFTVPVGYVLTTGYVLLDIIKTDVVVNNVFTLNVKNTGTNSIDVTASTRRSDGMSEWATGIATAKVTIPAGQFVTLTLAVTAADLHFVLDLNKIAVGDSFVIGGNITQSGVTGLGCSGAPNAITYIQIDGTGLFTTVTATPVPTPTPTPGVKAFQYKVDGTKDMTSNVVNLYLSGVTGHYDAVTDTATLYIMNTSSKTLTFQMCIGWAWDKTGTNMTSALGNIVDIPAGKAVKLAVVGLKNYYEKTATSPYYDSSKTLSVNSIIRLIIQGASKDDSFVMAGVLSISAIKGIGASPDVMSNLAQIALPAELSNLVNGYASEEDFDFDATTGTISAYLGSDTDIKIPPTIGGVPVNEIGALAFADNTTLTSVIIPDSVTKIGNGAFSGCTSLADITIPSSATSLGCDVFYNTAWQDNYPNDFVIVNGTLLYYKGTATVITIPSGVTTINGYAFYGCDTLTSVSIPSSVTSIGANTFEACTSLATINIPSSVSSIGADAFYGTAWLDNYVGDYVVVNNLLIYYKGTSSTVTIPTGVTSIGDMTFFYCDFITSLSIPSSVTSIGGAAFALCSSLQSVNIPSSVTIIGASAFEACDALTAINVDASNTNYSSLNGVLFDKNIITLIQCPGGLAGSYIVPANVINIGMGAFDGCNLLTGISLPKGLISIGDGAFYYCEKLIDIKIPNSVTSIGESAFSYCSSLLEINIPSSVTKILDGTFESCTAMTKIGIPSSITSIGTDAFFGCDSLSIYGSNGSYAQTYASANTIPFVNSFQVIFNSQNDVASYSKMIPENVAIASSELLSKANYLFCGWYKETACTNVWDFSKDALTANTNLYAKWRQYGDIDNNGTVAATDALMVLQASSGKRTLNDEDKLAADVDNNSLVTATDALQVLQFASGKRTSFN